MFQTSGNKLCGNRFDQFCLNKCKILQVNADAGFAAKRTADKSQKQACFQGLPPENYEGRDHVCIVQHFIPKALKTVVMQQMFC